LPLTYGISPWKPVPSLLFGRQPIKCVPDHLNEVGIFNIERVDRRMGDVVAETLL